MTYDSNVQPGAGATRLDLPGLTMWKLSVSDMHNNVYLLADSDSGEALLIDAADDAPAIRSMLRDAQVNEGRLSGIVTTHKHWDHHRALPEMAPLASQTMAGAKDAPELPVAPSRTLADGDEIELGEHRIIAHHVPGHTPGSVVLSWTPSDGSTPHLWTGDTLFPGGVGATNHSDEQSFDELYESVTTKLFGTFADAVVHPGHGDDTTLAAERPHLDEWRERGW